MSYKRLGDYIEVFDNRNKDLLDLPLLGVSVQKVFMPSIANTIGTDMTKYKIISKNQFTYIPDTSRRGDKIGVALLKESERALISQAYTTFKIKDENKLNPDYLMMWFSRPEFDRYARYHSIGSVREVFDWADMCEVQIPLPSIAVQRKIVSEYVAITAKIKTNEALCEKLEATAQALYKHWFVDFNFPTNSPPLEGCPQDGVVESLVDKTTQSFRHLSKGVERNTQNYMSLPYNPALKDRAKALRKAGNYAEVLFWMQVRNKSFKGLDFDRQKIIGNYIVDFYNANYQVVIEIDGSSHKGKEEYDAKRQEYLESLGLRVIRFTDYEVKHHLDSVMKRLEEHEVFNSPPKTGWSKTGVVKSPLVDKEPPRLSGTPPLEGNVRAMVYNEELEKEIPEGWEVKSLGEIAEIKGGKRLPKDTELNEEKFGRPYIRVADMSKNKFIVYNSEFLFVNDEVQKSISRYIVKKNDIIISIVGTIGLVNIVDDSLNEANLTENCFKITNLKKINEDYLYHYLVSKDGQREIEMKTVGGVQSKLPMYNVELLKITIPNQDLLDNFKRVVHPINKKLVLLKTQSQSLTKLQGLLLSRMAGGMYN